MRGMGDALAAMRKAATDGAPLTIYYAFKQSEAAEDGVTSAGWASFLQAVVDAGLAVDGTWPMRTELANRMIGKGANALASSIVLVCRRRAADAEVVARAELIRALKRELPEAIDDIRKAGVGPVDMQQSVIGPGMGVFTRYGKVLENDDSAMTVRTALSLINRVLGRDRERTRHEFRSRDAGRARLVRELRLRDTKLRRTDYARQREKHLAQRIVHFRRFFRPAWQDGVDRAPQSPHRLVACDGRNLHDLGMRPAHRAGLERSRWRRRSGSATRCTDGAEGGGRTRPRLSTLRNLHAKGLGERGAGLQRTRAGMGEARGHSREPQCAGADDNERARHVRLR